MSEETQQPDENGDSKESQNFVDRAKNFFTMGGDKNKWRKAIIVSILVIVFMGLSATAAWGSAIAFYIRSIGDPNGNTFTANGNYQVVRTLEVNITMYSPNMGSNNCDSSSGGDFHTADGNGKFVFQNGKIQWVSKTKTLDHIFAEPTNYSIIPWKQIDQMAVQVPGLFGDTPIEIHDTYAPGNHVTHGQVGNFLDLFYNCGDGNTIGKQIEAIQKQQGVKQIGSEGTTVRVNIVQPAAGGTTSGSNSSMDFRGVGTSLGQYDQVGIWKNITDVQNAVGTPGKNIVSYTFMGHRISSGVNKAITSALDKVQADLKATGVTYNFSDIQGTSVRENTNRKGTISPHGFGTAIDINPNQNPNNKRSSISGSQARDSSSCPTNIPKTVSDIFQKNGFFWGGKFFCTCDTMHFQYGGNYDTSQISWPDFKLLPADTTPGCPK